MRQRHPNQGALSDEATRVITLIVAKYPMQSPLMSDLLPTLEAFCGRHYIFKSSECAPDAQVQ